MSALEAHLRVSANAWRSKRLIYRAQEDNAEDHQFLRDSMLNDALAAGIGLPFALHPMPQDDAAEFSKVLKKRLMSMIICLPSSTDASNPGTPIGHVSLRTSHPTAPQHRTAELAIIVVGKYQNSGYGTEAVNWALDWGFRFGGLHRVSLSTYSYNGPAIKIYERCGFVREGELRESLWFNRRWCGQVLYSILESEWELLRSGQNGGIENGSA